MTRVDSTTFHNGAGRQHFGRNYGPARLEQNPCFQELMAINPKGKVIELACGDGHVMKGLLKAGFDVHGFDASEIMLGLARFDNDVTPERLNLLDIYETPLPFPDNTVDVAFCSKTLSYLQDPLPAIRELLRVVKPSGNVLIDYFHEQYADPARERIEQPVYGYTATGKELSIPNYAFQTQRLLAQLSKDFDIARVDIPFNTHSNAPVNDATSPQIEALPNGYLLLKLQKG